MKNYTYLLPLFLAIALAVGFYLGKKNNAPFFSDSNSGNINYDSKHKLFKVMDVIKNEYVDSISEKELTDKTIDQLLSNLDPHSVYIPYQKNDREADAMRGEFAGVGVKFIILHDSLYVTNVIENGPSAKAGLKNGDLILKIDTTPVAGIGLKNEQVMKLLKGKPGSKVKVTVLRQGKPQLKTIIRGLIPIKSITAAFMLKEKVGYIRLVRFGETSSKEFYFASQKLLDQGMEKLVFDLRGNGGGYLQIAEEIVDEFLKKGKKIVFTKEKSGKKNYTYSTAKGVLKNIDLAVLIDSESASASEIVAGAVQDNDRGQIFGRRSFGKGLVQKQITLPDSSSLRITIARYYTPTGRSIQKPYEKGNHYDYMMELYDRDRNGELFEVDSTIFADSLKFTTPQGKIVYGGGGIMPDVFIPYDTLGYSTFYKKVAYSRILTEFSIQYLSTHRRDLSSKSLNHFLKNFQVTNKLFNQFIEFAKSKDITGSYTEIQTSRQRLSYRIKEEIATGIWDEEGREYINSRNNNDLKVVLKNI